MIARVPTPLQLVFCKGVHHRVAPPLPSTSGERQAAAAERGPPGTVSKSVQSKEITVGNVGEPLAHKDSENINITTFIQGIVAAALTYIGYCSPKRPHTQL